MRAATSLASWPLDLCAQVPRWRVPVSPDRGWPPRLDAFGDELVILGDLGRRRRRRRRPKGRRRRPAPPPPPPPPAPPPPPPEAFVPAAAAAAAPVPPPPPAPAGMTQAEATLLVYNAYRSLLGRQPTASELAEGVSGLTSGALTLEALIRRVQAKATLAAAPAAPVPAWGGGGGPGTAPPEFVPPRPGTPEVVAEAPPVAVVPARIAGGRGGGWLVLGGLVVAAGLAFTMGGRRPRRRRPWR